MSMIRRDAGDLGFNSGEKYILVYLLMVLLNLQL